MLALTSCTGKLGTATLNSLLQHSLIPPANLVICTSYNTNDSRWDTIKSKGSLVRPFNYNTPSSSTFHGCTKLLLISSPVISLDFNSSTAGTGREKHHIDTINAAIEGGVRHVYYTSLAFGDESVAGVMRAHLRTEEYLHDLEKKEGGKVKVTIIREGLYNSSWPLYLGYYDIKNDGERDEIILAGDGKVSWTSIADLGLATALIIADESERWVGKTVYLSSGREAKSMEEIAGIVGGVRGRDLSMRKADRDEFVRYCVEERGRDRGAVEWWVSTYAALERGECAIQDSTLDDLLASKGVVPKPVEETIREMVAS